MELSDYQKKAMRTANKGLSDNDQLMNGVIGIGGEAGELLNKIKKHKYQGHDFSVVEIVEELGDIMWYVALVADSIGWNIDTIAQNNIAKLEKRYPEKFTENHSINRSV